MQAVQRSGPSRSVLRNPAHPRRLMPACPSSIGLPCRPSILPQQCEAPSMTMAAWDVGPKIADADFHLAKRLVELLTCVAATRLLFFCFFSISLSTTAIAALPLTPGCPIPGRAVAACPTCELCCKERHSGKCVPVTHPLS